MFRPCLPPARSNHALTRLARAIWTLPTNAIGHAIGLLMTGAQPKRIGGAAAEASLYVLGDSRFARILGAMAIGNVILAEGGFIAGNRGRWVLAHELSHTRQHAWLGPFYVPIHLALQIVSVLASSIRRVRNFPPQHAYNPLERLALYVPFDALVDPEPLGSPERDRIFAAFGLTETVSFVQSTSVSVSTFSTSKGMHGPPPTRGSQPGNIDK